MRTDCDFCLHPECCDICSVPADLEPDTEPEKEPDTEEELNIRLLPGEIGVLMSLLVLYSEKAAVLADNHGLNNVVIEDKLLGVLNAYYEGAR